MSLSVYVGHVIAITALGIEELPGSPLPVLAGFATGAAIFATVWLRYLQRGPLELLLNAATRGARYAK